MAELVTLVDSSDNIIGTKDRNLLTDNDRWRVVQIWISDRFGKILIAKRGPQKKNEPNLWEPGASGTVSYPDSYEMSASRELEEELGIKTEILSLEKVIFYKKPLGYRACGLFRLVIDENPTLKLQKEEVAGVKWIDIEELEK